MFNTARLLESKGHQVAFFSMEHGMNINSEWSRFFVKNVEYNTKHSMIEQLRIAANTLYSAEAETKISDLVDYFKPDIAHLYNFHHQLTPSILSALKRKHVPMVMTLNDYKLVCPSYTMLKGGELCEMCKGKRFYYCLLTRCLKGSLSKSLVAMIESYLHHQILNSYRPIDCFICPSEFILRKAREMGLAGNFIHLPHFLNIDEYRSDYAGKENSIIYFGRLSKEKGLFTLIEAMKGIKGATLKIIGDGPLRSDMERRVKGLELDNVHFLGYKIGEDLKSEIRSSLFAVVPSEWYEVLAWS